jgi:16S rRNA (uracil1498-N3)-methyltransferase
MELYYAPEFANGNYTLPDDEARHAIKVLRRTVGDTLSVTDGMGTLYKVQIISDNIKKCTVQIVETVVNFEKRSFYLHLAVAPTKNTDRYEWMLEKAVEIGVDEITPIICNRSERRNINTERLQRVAISAMKQSVKAYLPKINEAVKLKDFAAMAFEGKKYIGYCIDNNRQSLKNCYSKNENALVLIGPEGDFTPDEIEICIKNKFQPITLGKSRLRTETAGLAACQIINFLNE